MDAIIIKKTQSGMLRPVGWFFRRFHMLIFFVFIVGCLSVAVVLLNDTLTKSSNQELTSRISSGSIDAATLEQINSLQQRHQADTPPTLPEGRINPFGE